MGNPRGRGRERESKWSRPSTEGRSIRPIDRDADGVGEGDGRRFSLYLSFFCELSRCSQWDRYFALINIVHRFFVPARKRDANYPRDAARVFSASNYDRCLFVAVFHLILLPYVVGILLLLL